MDHSGAVDLGATDKTEGPCIRLLVCLDCQTIDELPDHQGHPDEDYLLQLQIDEHHTNWTTETTHRGNLLRVEMKWWANDTARKEIVKQIREGSGGMNELDPDFYDTKSNFAADALDCFAAHLRPKGQCPDYWSDSKKLVPKTKAIRREAGLPDPKDAPNLPRLCQFCPVHVYNVTQARAKSGLYK